MSCLVNAVGYSDYPTMTVRTIPEQAVTTHGPRLWFVCLLAASATALMYLAWLENKPSDVWRDEFAVDLRVSILLAIAAIFTIIAVRTAFRRVIVTSQEIASRGIFGEKRMRWEDSGVLLFRGKSSFLPPPSNPTPSCISKALLVCLGRFLGSKTSLWAWSVKA